MEEDLITKRGEEKMEEIGIEKEVERTEEHGLKRKNLE